MKQFFRAYLWCALLLILVIPAIALSAQNESRTKMIDYTIGWDKSNTHLFDITIQVATDRAGDLEFALPTWRPGRYQIQNYARNIQSFSASDEKGQALSWEKLDKSVWRVQNKGAKKVEVRYRYYANTLDAGSSLLSDQEAYFNGTNLFMYLVDRRSEPCQLKILAPPNWQIATALKREEGTQFSAANYDTLADSPTIASPSLLIQKFQQNGVDFYIAFQGKLNYDIKTIETQVSRIVSEQIKLFGNAPFQEYWFLYHITPGGRWHGVEHSYSTSITMPQAAFATEQSRQSFYAITSHEFFHAWNVKRILPQVFNPPDYSREAYTRLLWFFEGVTSYYGDLLMRRANIIDERIYLAGLARTIGDLQNAPGRLLMSAEDASFNNWLQPDDAENSQISFYTKGEILGLLLDMEIRRRTENAKSLDDVMRYLNENYAKVGQGVPEDGILTVVNKVTKSDFKDFFTRYVSGYEEIPYNQFVGTAGLQLTTEIDRARPEVTLGVRLSADEKASITSVATGSPAMAAGLDRGDILLAIDDQQVNSLNINEILLAYHPGDKVKATVFRNQKLQIFEITLAGGGNNYYQLKRLDKLSEAQQHTINSWLSANQ